MTTIAEHKVKKVFYADRSFWILIFVNIGTAYFAVINNWSLIVLIWIYWFQSVSIGIVNFIRIFQLKDFSTEGFRMGRSQVAPIQAMKYFIAFFFLIHYGISHAVYFMFLIIGSFSESSWLATSLGASSSYKLGLDLGDVKYILLTGVVFFANHIYSYFYNKSTDTKKPNIGHLMFYPYARIFPMHIIILAGGLTGVATLPLFLGLKIVADMVMHVIEHRLIRS
ncbi:MAG: DUF6498-containing protein [Patescibacteria group bacterium]